MVQSDRDVRADVGALDDLPGDDGSAPLCADAGGAAGAAGAAGAVMRLLAEGVPLTLLADLAAPDGPASQVILETEGLPDDPWWEPGPAADDPSDEASDVHAGDRGTPRE